MLRFKLIVSLILRFIFTLVKAPYISFNERNASYIVWAPNFFSLRFLLSDNFQKVWFTCFHLKKNGKHVTIYTNRDIGKFWRKKIIFFGSKYYNIFNFSNYIDSMVSLTAGLEIQNNSVFPDRVEVQLWENKCFMHQYFNSLKVQTPDTTIVDSNISTDMIKFPYPFLVKEEHSCSSNGVHKVSSKSDLDNLTNDHIFLKNNKKIIFQKLLNIRKDLRVVIVGDKIVSHYWRINLSSVWKPTATGFGSHIDFENFPERWREWILTQFKKLNIITGAFDIAWEDDNIETEPFILEVSVFYQPNPKPLTLKNLNNYGSWKKSLSLIDSYQKGMVDVIYYIQKEFVACFIAKFDKSEE